MRCDVHRHVVDERELDGQPAEEAVLGVDVRQERRIERVGDQLRGEQAADRRSGDRGADCDGRRHQEEEEGVVAEEIAVADRSPTARIRERHVDEDGHRRDQEGEHHQPLEGLAPLSSREEEDQQRQHAREEVRDQARVPPQQEVADVVREHGGQGVPIEDDLGQQPIGRAHHPGGLEGRLGRLERKAPIERRPIGATALIVHVAAAEAIGEEQSAGGGDEHRAHHHDSPPLPAQQRQPQHRRRREDIERLGEGGDPEQRAGDHVRPRSTQQPRPAIQPGAGRHGRRCHFLVRPEEEPQQDE